ncbi:hypothetical protein Nos7524_1510 [Nostoc sp. PCC 7524]|uniref:DUF6658 family protein n=1 Tax=Nostoc sp. (strain ATCC 29411 / PCC 7524) TaxID=28072 RepID=UPI00029EEF4D|nr:DUF6658 family protein [Nostoc sp. PCC 7524]AFY47386.1 hypothetical protein Nos7524_1510 [Nostoc sp. PCC 7524]
MDSLISLWKKLRLRQVLTVFLAGLLLVFSTACTQANPQGSNPRNPAVQAGGANNPYKNGGDNYTKYRMSTDPKINQEKDRASLQINPQVLIAVNRESELLYPGAETPTGRVIKEGELPIITGKDFQQPKPGGLIQREPDVGTRIQERIGTVQENVKEASGFLKEKADEASARPELQKNPAVGR